MSARFRHHLFKYNTMFPSYVEMTKSFKMNLWLVKIWVIQVHPCVAITVIPRILWLRRHRAALWVKETPLQCYVIIAELSKALSELLRGGVWNETRVLCCLLDGISIFLNINNFVWIWFDKNDFIFCRYT